jgi:dTDP-4-amino-4,6-dideoxygalactose transaminase
VLYHEPSFVSYGPVVTFAGGKPVPVATRREDDFQLTRALLEPKVTPKTKALLAVSILGNPAKLDDMRAFCDRHGLWFMEDNCESMDAVLPSGRKAGTLGDLNTFSFFFSHHISTMEGGMVLTDDLELYHLLKCMRAQGWTRDIPPDSPLFKRGASDHFGRAGRGHHHRQRPGIDRRQQQQRPGHHWRCSHGGSERVAEQRWRHHGPGRQRRADR